MRLLIDDIRDSYDVDIVARNWTDGKKFLKECPISVLYLDHDLGEELEKRTGYDILEWGLHYGYIPNKVVLVTANPVGYYKMKMALEYSGYKEHQGGIFKK